MQTAFIYDCAPHLVLFKSRYTGKERDAESGLDYFGARYYASNMGRWMSPDWADKPEAVPYSSLDDPQTLNLYQYVRNNPLARADKDGHCFWDLCIGEGVATYIAVAAVATAATVAVEAYIHSPQGQAAIANLSNAVSSALSPAAPVGATQPRTAQDPLPRDKDGRPVPDAEAAGNPHTQLGVKDGRAGPMCKDVKFDANGKPVKDIDHTDHGRPKEHPDVPHEHPYRPSDGKRMPQQPVDPKPPTPKPPPSS